MYIHFLYFYNYLILINFDYYNYKKLEYLLYYYQKKINLQQMVINNIFKTNFKITKAKNTSFEDIAGLYEVKNDV